MALRKHYSATLVLGSMIWAACSTAQGIDQGAQTGDDDTMTGGMGSDPGTGGGSGSGTTTPPDNSTPVYPTAHPRIYLTPNRSRLMSGLSSSSSAAMRFKSLV